MKTFEQFLSEAGAPSQERTGISNFFARGGRGTSKQGRLAREREEAITIANAKKREAEGLPPGSSGEQKRQEIARQMAAQKAEQEAEQKKKDAEQKKKDALAQAAELLSQRSPEEIAIAEKRKKAIERSKKRAEKKAAQQRTPEA